MKGGGQEGRVGVLLVEADHLVKDSKFSCLPHLALTVDFWEKVVFGQKYGIYTVINQDTLHGVGSNQPAPILPGNWYIGSL